MTEEHNATERTLLLRHGRPALVSSDSDDDIPSDHKPQPMSLSLLCLYTILLLFVAALLAFAAMHFAIGRLMHQIDSHGGPDLFAQKALVYDLDAIKLTDVQDEVVTLHVQGRAGVDVAKGLDWSDPSLFGQWQRHVTRWAVKKVKKAQVRVGQEGVVLQWQAAQLLRLLPQDPITLPIRYGSQNEKWLEPFELPIQVCVISSTALAEMAKDAWDNKRVALDAKLTKSKIQTRWASVSIGGFAKHFDADLPHLSFLDDPSKLVNLTQYTITPKDVSGRSRLDFTAQATLTNPLVVHRRKLPAQIQRYLPLLGNATSAMPWTVPFEAFLLSSDAKDDLLLGRVSLMPFDFAPFQPVLTLNLTGQVSPASNKTAILETALSNLLTNYLQGEPTPIRVKPLESTALPGFLNKLAAQVDPVLLQLPGSPDPDVDLLQNVRIEQLSLDGTGPNSELLCSGQIIGDLILPPGLEGLYQALNLSQLWPDVLIYDGAATALDPLQPFPPQPAPANAFARVRPLGWSHARTTLVKIPDPERPGHKRRVTQVDMRLKSVPFAVLPGRADVFRGYVAKLLLGTGDGPRGKVQTGVSGFTRVKAEVKGLGRLQLEDIAVKGTFYVGKTGL